MIFLTVGTQFPFDRLVRAVDEFLDDNVLGEDVFAQIGKSTYLPRNFEAIPSLEKGVFDAHFFRASAVISHAGMGTITMALENSKPLLTMPRLRRYGEVVNDHQLVLATRFAALGHILLAHDETELPGRLAGLKSFVPRPRKADPDAVARRIGMFLVAHNS
jgi:beta-1,4-N-acetylglucosaminyltransferase